MDNTGIILLLIFILVTFCISAYEKVYRWEETLLDFLNMYSKYFGELLVKVITIFILLAEVLIATLALFALYKIYSSGTLDFARYTFIGSSLVFIILLIGLRIIRDYEGASRIAIYFGVTSLGLLWTSLA